MIDERARRQLFQLNREAWAEISASALPQSVKTAIYMHLVKPWVPSFLSVAISPLRAGLEQFLKRGVFGHEGLTFYYPTAAWWEAHTRGPVHAPEGAGCDVDAHVDYFTAGGASPEFVYANVLKDGSFYVLDRADFDLECAFFAAGAEVVS